MLALSVCLFQDTLDMALSLVPIAVATAHGTVQILTKPWPWVLFVSWLVIAGIDLGVLSAEVRQTVQSLWWVVGLLILCNIAIAALRYGFQERGKTIRHEIRRSTNKK